MSQASHQLLSTSWLDDINGPAKLTAHQKDLIAKLEDLTAHDNFYDEIQDSNDENNADQISHPTISFTEYLKPKWETTEVIDTFQEERLKIVSRGDECKRLLADTDSVLEEILTLENLYLFISPKTSQLHSQCKSIIQEKNDLKQSFDKINTSLNKQEELKSIMRRLPDIRNQIVSILTTVFQSYQTSQEEGCTPLDEYYGRFFVESRRIKELVIQLESCLTGSETEELLLHLEDIYTVYFDTRERLIEPIFTKNIRALVSKCDRNYCDLLKQTCSSLVRVLRNEIQLFNQIFTSNDSDEITQQNQKTNEHAMKRQILSGFLELLCKVFYENLRPVVIHVNHLETLTELYKLVNETMRPEVSDDTFQSTMNALAEDIQERMIFRAEVFIKDSVLDYKPSRGDLAYPEILELVAGGELKDFQSMWYPTVQRTVLALYYLDRVFDPITFRELAQEVAMACFRSLDLAQRLLDERHGGTKIEASLFLSKHIAIIRDQLMSYGIERIQFTSPPKDGQSSSELVEIDTSNLESMLKLFHENQFSASSSDSLWSKLNETIVSGTKWTLRATRIRN